MKDFYPECEAQATWKVGFFHKFLHMLKKVFDSSSLVCRQHSSWAGGQPGPVGGDHWLPDSAPILCARLPLLFPQTASHPWRGAGNWVRVRRERANSEVYLESAFANAHALFSYKRVYAMLCSLFQELLVLRVRQPESAAAVGLVQAQTDHPAGTHVFPLQLQTLYVWDPQDGGGDGNQTAAGQERHRIQDQRRPGFM